MRILICDDDSLFLEVCETLLQRLAEKHGVDATIETVTSGTELLFYKDTKYADVDVLYLDYWMDGLNGMETARELRRCGMTMDIVFCSKDESFAIDAYEVDALSYIGKDQIFGGTKFEDVFVKAVRRYHARETEVLTFSHGRDHRSIPIRDILYFEISNRTVTVHYLQGRKTATFDFTSSLSDLEARLAGKGFFRSHSAFLASERHIRRRTEKYLEMNNGDRLPIGKSRQGKSPLV